MFNQPMFKDPSYLDGWNDAHNSDRENAINLIDAERYLSDEWYAKGVDSKGGGFYMIYMGEFNYNKSCKFYGLRNTAISGTMRHHLELLGEGFEVVNKKIYEAQKALLEKVKELSEEQSEIIETVRRDVRQTKPRG